MLLYDLSISDYYRIYLRVATKSTLGVLRTHDQALGGNRRLGREMRSMYRAR